MFTHCSCLLAEDPPGKHSGRDKTSVLLSINILKCSLVEILFKVKTVALKIQLEKIMEGQNYTFLIEYDFPSAVHCYFYKLKKLDLIQND